MNKLIITGGLGFIGKNFYSLVKNLWDEIIILDKATYAADIHFINKIIRKKDRIIFGDVCDYSFLDNTISNDYNIVHFAAESHVDKSFTSSIEFTKNNALGTHTLLEVCRSKNVKKIIVISTDEVYGSTEDYINEDSSLKPTNPYSASKAGADLISQTYYKTFKLPLVIVRPNNVYGPRQFAEKIIPALINAVHGGGRLRIHGEGKTERFFLHVNDLSKALILIFNNFIPGEIYNINGSTKIKIIDLIKYVADYKKIDINKFADYVQNRPFNDQVYTINGDKIRKLGWREEMDFFSSLNILIDEKSYIK